MSNPMVICDACGDRRDCTLHTRAEFPPDAAKAWMRRTCEKPKGSCRLRYQAGIGPFPRIVGMSDRAEVGE
jgi:hypothetical protein